MVHGIDHHNLEEILEVTVEKLHQRLTQLWSWISSPRLEGWDVVLRDAKPACQLTLRQVVLEARGAQSGGSDLDIHDDYNL